MSSVCISPVSLRLSRFLTRWGASFHYHVCNHFHNKCQSVKELLGLTIFTGVSAAVGYSVYFTTKNFIHPSNGIINQTIKKDQEKVVDTVDIESIGDKKVFCRCWKSKKVNNLHFSPFLSFRTAMVLITSIIKRLVTMLVHSLSKERRQSKLTHERLQIL